MRIVSKSCLLAAVLLAAAPLAPAAEAGDPMLAHMVYFSLAEKTDDARDRLVAACHEHLSGHEGTVYFSVGTLAEDLKRELNDREFDVALNLVFRDKAAHDTYQTHERHLKFIDENKELWNKVRVFDSYLTPSTETAAALPKGAAGFAGMVEGKVVARQEDTLTLSVTRVTRVWKTNDADDPQSLVGAMVTVQCRQDGGPAKTIARFISLVEEGQTIEIDVAHREGDTLSILELTDEQRKQVTAAG